MDLAFRRPRANSTPTDQIRCELRRKCIKELAADRETKFSDVEEESPCEPKTFVNLEGAVHVRIIYETFPPDSRTGFLEVDAHDDE